MADFATASGASEALLTATAEAVEAATRASALQALGYGPEEVEAARQSAASAEARMHNALSRLAAGR